MNFLSMCSTYMYCLELICWFSANNICLVWVLFHLIFLLLFSLKIIFNSYARPLKGYNHNSYFLFNIRWKTQNKNYCDSKIYQTKIRYIWNVWKLFLKFCELSKQLWKFIFKLSVVNRGKNSWIKWS